MVAYTRRSNSDQDVQPVAIQSVDPLTRTASCMTRLKYLIDVDCSFGMGETVVTPAVGEQWYIERFDQVWRLKGRIPHLDETLLIEPEEGQVIVGGTRGPLELNGTEIRINNIMRIEGHYYRDNDGILEHSEDGDLWIPVVPPAGPGAPASTDFVPEGTTNKYFTVLRAANAAPVQSVAGRTGAIVLVKADVGLGLVDNTSDLNKPISTAVANALGVKADLVGGVVPAAQLPIKVTTYANLAAFPISGVTNAIYIADDTHFVYYWNGTGYILIAGGGSGGGAANTDALPEGTTNLYFTTARASAAAPVQSSDTRLSDTRTPTDNTVTTIKIVDGNVTLAKLAPDVQAAIAASPYDVSYPQATGVRAIGLGQATIGVKIQRDVVFSKITYRCGTADASGSSTFEIRKNGVQVAGSSLTVSAASQVAGGSITGAFSFTEGDILTVYVSAVGTTPGVGLVADLKGNA